MAVLSSAGEFGIVYKAHLLKSMQMVMRSNVDPQTVAVKTLKGIVVISAEYRIRWVYFMNRWH